MAQDLLDRFTALHNMPASTTSDTVAPLVCYFGHACIRYPKDIVRYAWFSSVLSALYNNTGIIVRLVWASVSADASFFVKWGAQFHRHQEDVAQLASFWNFGVANGATVYGIGNPSTLSGAVKYTDIVFSADQIGGILPLESYMITIWREGNNDNVADHAYLYKVILINAV